MATTTHTMRPTHNGVLVPDELLNATTAELDAYAATVKQGNRAFVNAYFALEDEARRRGISLDEER